MSRFFLIGPKDDFFDQFRKSLETLASPAEVFQYESDSFPVSELIAKRVDAVFIYPENSAVNPKNILAILKSDPSASEIPILLTGTEPQLEAYADDISEMTFNGILKFPMDEFLLKLELLKIQGRKLKAEKYEQDQFSSKPLSDLEIAHSRLKKSESELKLKNEELKNREALFRTIIDNAPFEIWARDKDQIGILENSLSVKHFGTILNQKPKYGNISAKIVKLWKSNNNRALHGETIQEDCIYDDKNYHQIIAPIILDDQIEGIVGFNIDISARKQTEEALISSEGKFRAVFENSTDGILIINEEGIITEMNQSLEHLSGYKRSECIGIPVWDFQYHLILPHDKNETSYQQLKSFIRQKYALDNPDIFGKLTQHKIMNHKGQLRYIESILYPVQTNENRFIVSVTRDITERKLFEDALKNSESKYYGIFDANHDGISIFLINKDRTLSNFVEANKAAYEMVGYTKKEFLSMNVHDLQLIQQDSNFDEKIEELKKGKHVNVETKIRHKDGYILAVDLSILLIQYNNQPAVMNIVRNITERKKLDAELLESEKLYRNLVERLPDGVYKSTHEGRFIEVNPAMVKMLGYSSKEELMAIDIKSELYFEPEDRESMVLQEELEEMGVFRLKKRDGSEIWVEDHGWYTQNEEGEIIFHEGIMRDITERRIAEVILRESEERFKLLFDKAPVGYQSLDENGIFIDVNETWLELMGYSKEEVLGNWFGNYLTADSVKLFKKLFPVLKRTGKSHAEFEMNRKDGSVIIIQLEGRVGHTPEGGFKQTHCVISDITERRKAEKAIADERILLRTLIDNIPDLIYVKDTLGRKIISNKADLNLIGLPEHEVLGKTDFDYFDPEIAKLTFADDQIVIQNAKPIINKLEQYSDVHGNERYLSTSKFPLFNESGHIIGLVGVGYDITQKRITEQKLIQLSKGIEQSPASVIITDIHGNIEYVNSKLVEITGYLPEELIGKNPRIFQSGYTTKEEYDLLWRTISSGNEYRSEIQNQKRNGDLFWESVLISPIRDDSGKIVNYLAIKEDITDRKKADLEIQKLSVAIEQNPASVIITDTEGKIEYVNKKFLTTSGYSRSELLGKIVRILKAGHTPDEIYIEIWNNLFAGKQWSGEHQNRTKKREKYWESVLISPINNSEGKITNFIILSEDISERKRMEKDLITAKEKAEESDRLKSAFLANMSHEIRTPLNSILGFSDLLTDPDLDSATRTEFAGLINNSGNNLLGIINDVLDISKIEAGQIVLSKQRLSAQSLIVDIQKEYSYKAKSKGIDLKLASGLPKDELFFMGDEIRIKQVLINFVGNAIKFTEKGFIEIGVKLEKGTIRFHVKDTGIGIPKEFHDKVFDRFRQVEPSPTRKYGGNGLGLAITKNLAELMGGKIWLESKFGHGSTFYFGLPDSLLIEE